MLRSTRLLLAHLGAQLLREVLIRSLRGSLLIGGALLTISSTGLWQYMASSFNAHDMRRAAAWSASTVQTDVVVVAIDDTGFNQFFGGRSPLEPQRLLELLRVVHASSAQAHALALDLDLSPLPGEDRHALLGFLANHDPARWVLVDPVLSAEDPMPERAAWREALCASGVRLAHPFQPTEFGYVSASHQFKGGLAEVANDPTPGCTRHLARLSADQAQLRRVSSPMSASLLRDGVVIPFTGDLAALQLALESLQPRQVIVGGTWGRLDVFGTPFGERYGVQVHAAAMQGQALNLRTAPYVVQLLSSWLVVAMLSMLFTQVYQQLAARISPWANTLPGHQFLMTRLWPLSLMVLTIAALLLVAEALALLYAHTGYWIPSATVVATVFVTVIFVWNWGLNDLVLADNLNAAWTTVVAQPIKKDAASMANAWRRLCASGPSAAWPTVRRSRAALELALASVSLLAQTAFPLASLAYALAKPL